MKTLTEIYSQQCRCPIAPKYENQETNSQTICLELLKCQDTLLLWRINFGSYTTQSTHHKYFYTTYGIDAQKEL